MNWLFVSNYHFRASSAKVNIDLANIGHEIKAANADFAHRLDRLLQKVSEPNIVIISESHVNAGSQQTTSLMQSESLFATRKASSFFSRDQIPRIPQFQSRGFLPGQFESKIGSNFPAHARTSPQPASPLERSSNFYPEQYWLGNGNIGRQSLLTFRPYEECFSASSRTIIYEAYYFRSPRAFKKLTLKLSVARGSKYWMVLKAPSITNYISGYRGRLPNGLSKQIESRITELDAEELDNISNLDVFLSDKSANEKHSKQLMTVTPMKISPTTMELGVIGYLRDLGCPRYFEDELAHISYVQRPTTSTVCLQGNIVFDVKVNGPLKAKVLYTIQVLHCLQGCIGVPKFFGIVTSASGHQLKSYLSEIVLEGSFFQSPQVDYSIVPWHRRAKWAWQIIQAVKEAHSRGFVVGSVGIWNVLVNHIDNAILWKFTKFISLRSYNELPPEFSQQEWDGSLTDRHLATTKSDIYMLGLLLWQLARPKVRYGTQLWCEIAGCQKERCKDRHISTALPVLPEYVPQYYQDLISSCRAEQPLQRPAARDLLAKFPSYFLQETWTSDDTAAILSHDVTQDLKPQISCDICEEIQTISWYHCDVCYDGDYDICEACFAKGLHCKDSAHFIHKVVGEDANLDYYYSSKGSSGERTVLEY